VGLLAARLDTRCSYVQATIWAVVLGGCRAWKISRVMHDLVFGFALPEAAGEVVAGGLVTTQAHDQDDVQGSVGVAVATAVELVPDRFAAGCFQWADSAEFGN
jgi:hypothetical protein